MDAGWVVRGDLGQRRDVACFTSGAVNHPMELLGRPRLELRAGVDQPGFDFCAALPVVKPHGLVLQVTTGVARWTGVASPAIAALSSSVLDTT